MDAFVVWILLPCGAIYLFHHLLFYRGLRRLKPGTSPLQPSVSVIISARNEAAHIGYCLESLIRQRYPADRMEIIVVDDQSSDGTAATVHQFMKQDHRIRLLQSPGDRTLASPKKQAIAHGIHHSRHDIIVTADADCTYHPDWLATLVSHFEPNVGVVAGWVSLAPAAEQQLFDKLQSLDVLSLVILGAGAIGAGMPLIANGASFAYRRQVFHQVDGFSGIDHIASGDDDLLLQKIVRSTNWHIRSATPNGGIVYTYPASTLRSFIRQRIRWASKGRHYPNVRMVVYLTTVYLFLLGLLVTVPGWFVSRNVQSVAAGLLFLKWSADALLLWRGLGMAGRRDLFRYFIPAELFQMFYVVIAGAAGMFATIHWKERL